MSLHQSTFYFICSHLASGQKEGDELRRNSDVTQILKNTRFWRICKNHHRRNPKMILEHDRVIWLGDLNYRIALSYLEVKTLLEQNVWDALLEKDQLRIEREAGRVFEVWKEKFTFHQHTNTPTTQILIWERTQSLIVKEELRHGGYGSYLLGLNKKTYEQAGVGIEGNGAGSYRDPGIGWMTGFSFTVSFVGILILITLRKVKEVEDFMEMLTKNLQEANEETKSVTKAFAMRGIKKRMDKEMDEVAKVARAIKMKLEEIDQDASVLPNDELHFVYFAKNPRQTIQDEYREVVERRVFTAVKSLEPEQLRRTKSSLHIADCSFQAVGLVM